MRVRKICQEYGLKEPVFKEVSHGFQVVLYKGGENVVENETQITQLLYQNKSYSAYEIAKILNKSERTIQRYLNLLINKKRIQRIGPDKGGHWEIINRS